MKKLIVGLIVGALLATAGTAGAYTMYWSKAGSMYSCRGTSSLAICNSKLLGHYQANFNNGGVILSQNGNPVFSCKPGYDALDDCTDFR